MRKSKWKDEERSYRMHKENKYSLGGKSDEKNKKAICTITSKNVLSLNDKREEENENKASEETEKEGDRTGCVCVGGKRKRNNRQYVYTIRMDKMMSSICFPGDQWRRTQSSIIHYLQPNSISPFKTSPWLGVV